MTPDNFFLPHDLGLRIIAGAESGIARIMQTDTLAGPPSRRPACREPGLAIGLLLPACLAIGGEIPREAARHTPLVAAIVSLARLAPLREDVIATWRDPRARQNESWQTHEDINAVMLAAALARRGFLVLTYPESRAGLPKRTA